ncbi:MAG: DUF5119 domain-containing protein [Prevotella sp.]|nr:DUF5119 domain-containing protein [Prevotella sp.]
MRSEKRVLCRKTVRYAMTIVAAIVVMLSSSCRRNPDLHLWDWDNPVIDLPVVDLNLEVYWDYMLISGISYDWRTEWYYGWDEEDKLIFGELGYTQPTSFNLRRYYTGDTPLAPHDKVRQATVTGHSYSAHYDWGFWDILVWNDVHTLDGIQSLIFDETTSLDYVTAYTNQSMNMAPYHAPRYQNAFYEPEALYAAYEQAIEINRNLDGFVYDEKRDAWVRTLKMMLEPITYIYLPQVILYNNNGRITMVSGTSNLSGMARTTTLNTGVSGDEPVAVYFKMRMKKDKDKDGRKADIVGGRVMTFGICGQNANRIKSYEEVKDEHRHYLDVTMQFNNGMDSTFVFDVTNQVRRRYKGGVLTVELDMDTVPTPKRSGGSGFNAVVKDVEDGGTHEFEL